MTPASVLEIAARQDGLATAGQCAALGIAPTVLARLVRGGAWRAVHRAVYLTRPAPLSDRGRIRAALLANGPAAVAVLTSAGTVHGWPVLPADATVQVSLPAVGHRLDRPGITTRQLVLEPDDVTEVDGLRVTTPARTVADLLRRCDRFDGVAMLDAALREKRLRDEDLEAALALVYGNRGAVAARAAIRAADARAQSPLETRVRLICADGGVPAEELQFPVYDRSGGLIAVADLGWPSRGVLAEADGREVHSAPEALLHDRRRQNALLARGFVVLRFTWSDTYRPAYIVQTVRQALRDARP